MLLVLLVLLMLLVLLLLVLLVLVLLATLLAAARLAAASVGSTDAVWRWQPRLEAGWLSSCSWVAGMATAVSASRLGNELMLPMGDSELLVGPFRMC